MEAYAKEVEDFYYEHRPATVAAFKGSMMVLGKELHRAPSRIPDAGMGLFAKVALKKGDVFTWYSGAHVTYQDKALLAKSDPQLKAYLRAVGVGLHEFVVGNYRRAYPDTPRRFVQVAYDKMDEAFHEDGAAQFMNGRESLTASDVNVACITVYSKLRAPPPLQRHEGESDTAFRQREALRSMAVGEALIRQYPDEALIVALALDDIAPDTELLTSYGAGYFGETKKKPMARIRSLF